MCAGIRWARGRMSIPWRRKRWESKWIRQIRSRLTVPPGMLACNPEALIEVCDEPPASHADAAVIAPIGPDAEVAARQQIQADTVASNEGVGAATPRSSGRTQTPTQIEAVRIERPRELRGATWQIPFDGQTLYVT